jgi:hypothetical protein
LKPLYLNFLNFIGFNWEKDCVFDKEESILSILASIGHKLESKIFIMESNEKQSDLPSANRSVFHFTLM